jgi:hypothetical protein
VLGQVEALGRTPRNRAGEPHFCCFGVVYPALQKLVRQISFSGQCTDFWLTENGQSVGRRSSGNYWQPGGWGCGRFSRRRKKNDEQIRNCFVREIARRYAGLMLNQNPKRRSGDPVIARDRVIGTPKTFTTVDAKGGAGLGQTHAKLGYLAMTREG